MPPVTPALPVALQHLVPTVDVCHGTSHESAVRTEVLALTLASTRSACACAMTCTLLLCERVNGTAFAATVVTEPTGVMALASTSIVVAAALVVALQPQAVSIVLRDWAPLQAAVRSMILRHQIVPNREHANVFGL